MSYIQPENSNRVNSIKQKFESPPSNDNSTDKKCLNEKTKESLCRTLSASPIAPRKNLKLNVTRQLSNPGRNIKRSPAFRGDKLARTRNLNSPTKERVISLVDKNVKLFEDKPEYGKLSRVKKKPQESTGIEDFGIVYDDVDSIIPSQNLGNENFDSSNKFHDGGGYGKLLSVVSEKSKDCRSQSLDRLNNKDTCVSKINERRDSVRTTVISRQKNISAVSGINDADDFDDEGASSRSWNRNEYPNSDEKNITKLDKFLKNGVEYTKVMKSKTSQFDRQKIENESSLYNSIDDQSELLDIRDELSRRKYEFNKKEEHSLSSLKNNSHERLSRWSKNLSDEDSCLRSHCFSNGDKNSAQTKLDFIPVKDIILRSKHNNLESRRSSSFGEVQDIFDNKLTDTLKAALKAPLPSGPPPKKPPRTFAHSPITNRSPVDDYEETDGFWQKKKVQTDEIICDNSELPDSRREKIRSFLHDTGSKQCTRNSRENKKQISADELNSDTSEVSKKSTRIGASQENCLADEKIPNLNSQLYRIKERNKNFSRNNSENSTAYEPVYTSTPNCDDLSMSLSKLGINSKQLSDAEKILNPIESTSRARGNFSATQVVNESVSSEENSTSPLNISYSPEKFKTSPVRSPGSSRTRTSKDSKEMLEKLEHVLIQHQKACGPKVIVPRVDKLDFGINSCSKLKSEGEVDTRNNNSRHKEIFQKRLSRTLEEGRKLGPLPNVPDAVPERSRNLGFDCLPSLNCAGNSSIYEQIQNPDFKTYLTDNQNSSFSERSENLYTKSSDVPSINAHFYLHNSTENSLNFINQDPYDNLAISPASKRLSTELTTFTDTKKQIINNTKKTDEHVYAEPFVFKTNLNSDVTGLESGTSSPRSNRRLQINEPEDSPKNFQKGAELHYMCTPIPTVYIETNNNNINNELTITTNNRQENGGANCKKSLLKLAILARPSPDKFDKTKIEQLLDQAFGQPVMAGSETPTDSSTSSDTDSLASTTSISEEYSTFNENLQIFKEKEKVFRPSKAELHRSQTDKRKHYVRRVSSRFSDRKEGLGANRPDKLFEVCLLVELNLSTKKPYIKDQYPIHAITPSWIENFCFPDGLDWPPVESDQNLAYTFVLTDEKGNRRYGYCRRVKPEGAPVCLPLAYCLVTKYRASGFYAKLLDELESRHGQPDITKRNFIEQLYNSAIPRPGQTLRLKPRISEVFELMNDVDNSATNSNVNLSKFTYSYEKNYRMASPKLTTSLLNSEKLKTSEELSDDLRDLEFTDDEYSILRLDDHRLEEKDMSQLFDAVSIKVLLILFASLLLERKVVLMCHKLSKLSSCVEALQSLLYPFSWLHPFIPFLPNIPEFSEILQAPSPFVIGILKQRNGFSIEVGHLEDGIVVDLDNSKVISAVGDESSILPSRLQKGLKSALQMVSNNTKSGDGFRNFLVSEAFLRVFVETCAHCDSHICTQQDRKVVFEKESFIKAGPSRGIQYFLEWFVETTMFNQFIQERIGRVEGSNPSSLEQMKLFDQRLAEYLKAADKNAQTKRGSNKKKTLGDRFKDLTNFN